MVSQPASINLASYPTIEVTDAASGTALVIARPPRAILVLFHFADRIRGWLRL